MPKEDKASKEEKTSAEDKICFLIGPIGDPESDIRKRSDQLFKHVFQPVAEELGYKPIRADQISEPGIITSQVIQHVVESPLVIADLTGRNPNVFYELAVRHAIRKPLVQMISRGEQIPFDVASTRTIQVDIHELDSVTEAKLELAKQIKSIEKGKFETDTPISVALDLKILKGGNPEQRSIADLLAVMADMRAAVADIGKRINSPETLLPPGYIDFVLRHKLPKPEYQETVFELRRTIEMLRGTIGSIAETKKTKPGELEGLAERLAFLEHRLDRLRHEE